MGGGRGGPGGGRGGFGPGTMIGPAFLKAMDANKDDNITQEEFKTTFTKWFDSWSKDNLITEDQLRAGIEKDLAPAGMPGGPGGMPAPPPL